MAQPPSPITANSSSTTMARAIGRLMPVRLASSWLSLYSRTENRMQANSSSRASAANQTAARPRMKRTPMPSMMAVRFISLRLGVASGSSVSERVEICSLMLVLD